MNCHSSSVSSCPWTRILTVVTFVGHRSLVGHQILRGSADHDIKAPSAPLQSCHLSGMSPGVQQWPPVCNRFQKVTPKPNWLIAFEHMDSFRNFDVVTKAFIAVRWPYVRSRWIIQCGNFFDERGNGGGGRNGRMTEIWWWRRCTLGHLVLQIQIQI